MKKIAGLDIGDAKIGVAIMDMEVKIAFPYKVLEKSGGKLEDQIIEIAKKEAIISFVAGLPLSEDGSENKQCERVKNFCRRLSMRTTIPIDFFDEFGTSLEAREITKGRKKDEDAEAAALMLQRYADSLSK